MSELAFETGLTDDQITAYIADPATIETHEIAREVIDCLDAEIANIQAQVDAAMVEANVRPLSEERQAWVKRASFAAAMRKNSRQRVYQRDKELRGFKGPATMEPKHSKEEKALKQQRLLVEAETRRDAKKLALQNTTLQIAKIAQQRRDLEAARSFEHRFYMAAKQLLSAEQIEAIKAEPTYSVSSKDSHPQRE
jgi:hypothetical protein